MSKFYIPKRVSKQVAEAGVWVDYVDDAGIEYGSYKLRYMDPFNQKEQLEKKRLWSKHGCNNKKEEDFTKRAAISLAYLGLLDWKLPQDPSDEKSKVVPFTPVDAVEYLMDEHAQHIRGERATIAGDNSQFQADEVEDTSKN